MTPSENIKYVTSFEELVSSRFHDNINAICWARPLIGDFAEIVQKIEMSGNIEEVGKDDLMRMELSAEGQLARSVILNDLELLEAHGAAPVLNVIRNYKSDDEFSGFPTDVYSFHVDRSPIPVDTFLCTYYGAPSEILPNSLAEQKVLVPEIRAQLKELYGTSDDGFELFLSENYFDLHYQAKASASPISLRSGQLWRLATDHPESKVSPCVHRAPKEKAGEKRLLLIC